jgi:chitin synthase
MATTSATLVSQAISSGELTDLVLSSTPATVYPTDDSILAVLSARFRADRIGSTNLVVLVNPYKILAIVDYSNTKRDVIRIPSWAW